MKAVNVKEFSYTIKRYKEILKMDFTDEEFVPFNYDEGANKTTGTIHVLMGFGNIIKCRLCRKCTLCSECLYPVATGSPCNGGENKKSYDAIKKAKTWEELKKAVSFRIKHMEDVLKTGIARKIKEEV